MATELLPVVDLRALSQPDLDALAAASAHALAPGNCPDADPLPPLKIDRAVFNESAGSRKQTFSRLRFGGGGASSSSAQSSAGQMVDPYSDFIAYHLRRLFFPDDTSLPPPPDPQTLAAPPDPDRETTNAKGISVDLLRLAGMEEPYDAELRRRTAGLTSETELQGFINSVGGKWASPRQIRKNVDASFFGDHLPCGWKLQLGLKRKRGSIWVRCFKYVSPKGNQFSTCKEVSTYLMSLLGYPEVKSVTNQFEGTAQHYLCANAGDDSVLGFQDLIGSSVDKPNANERNADKVNAYECQKCNLIFSDRTSYVQHHLSYHEMSAKRRRTGKFGEPVVGKDGNFECPICHKTFEDESRYFGHVGAHARYEGLTPEEFLDRATSRRETNDSLAEISFRLHELTEPPGQNKVSDGEAGFQHHNHSNKHGDNNSTVTDLFSTNFSDNFIRPNKAWSRPEDGPPFNVAPSVCTNTNFTGHADVSVQERASNFNTRSASNINSFAGVAIFNDQSGSNHVIRPTAFGTANHYQDQIIDHGMAAPKHAGNNTVKSRNVNLNACVNTISFPIANAYNETSATLNEAGFVSEAYNGDFCSGGITEKGFGQFTNSFTHIKPNASGCSVNRGDGSFTKGSSVNRPVNSNEPNVARLEVMGKSNNEMQNHYNDRAPGFGPHASASASRNADGRMPMQANFGSMPSAVQSVADVSRTSRSQDQCDLQLGFGAQKQQIFSSHGELRTATAGSPPIGSIAKKSSLPTGSSQFGSVDVSKSFPTGTSQFGGFAKPTFVPAAPSQFGSMTQPNYVHPAQSPQFTSMVQPNSIPPAESSQFGSKSQPNAAPPAKTSHSRGMTGPNSVPPTQSSPFGSMIGSHSVPPSASQFSGSTVQPNSVIPESSQFGSMTRPNSVPPVSSQFVNMPSQKFVSASEPTLVLGYAPQMGSGPPPPVQLGWVPRMVTGGSVVTCVCIWCNSQFHHIGPVDGPQGGSFGFICPACKDRMSGHQNMSNNGSWQP